MAVSTNKDHPENSPEGQKAKADAVKADQQVASGPQEVIDRETGQGFRGVEVDSTPNENYTLSGVTSGAPTPETDEGQAEQVRKDQKDVEAKANGVAQR
jgi:hypothetical protein